MLDHPPSLEITEIDKKSLPDFDQLEIIYEQFHDDGSHWVSIAKIPEGFFIRYFTRGDYLCFPSQNKIEYALQEGVDKKTADYILNDHIMPIYLSGLGEIVLHAGCITYHNSAYAFVGESGQGKSTISALLATHGYPLITDDSLLIKDLGNQFNAIPTTRRVRLWEESFDVIGSQYDENDYVCHSSKKYWLSLTDQQICKKPTPLKAIYHLCVDSKAPSPKIHSLKFSEAHPVLVEQLFTHNPKEALRKRFDDASRILDQIPVFEITYAHQVDQASLLVQVVTQHIKGLHLS